MNRWLAFISVTALLLSGISIGALGILLVHGHLPSRPPFGEAMPSPAVMLDHLDAHLGLSADQKRQIESILEESHSRSEEIRREIRPKLEKLIEETHQKVDALLTPEQRTKFEKLLQRQRSHVERFFLGERFHEGGHGPPAPPPPSPEP